MAARDDDPRTADVRRAVRALARAEKALERARDDLAKEIGAALHAGVRPTDLEYPVTPYKREHIRRIARSQGVPPKRDVTVTVTPRSASEPDAEGD